MKISLPVVFVLALLMALPCAHADDEAPATTAMLALETSRVVVFKDGYSLFVRQGEATADAKGNVFTYDVPDAAVLGSFWAFSKDRALVGMHAQIVSQTTKRSATESALSILDLLRANQGKRVTLGLTGDKEIVGLIDRVLDRPRRVPELPPGTLPPARPDAEVAPEGGHFVVLRDTARGQIVLPISHVITISGESLETNIGRKYEKVELRKRLQFSLGEAHAGKPAHVTVMYFTPGLRWIPTYRLSGELEDSATLALQGELLNEVMDLDEVAADLVVGVPHFKFREVISPLALEAQLQNALQRAAPQLMGQRTSNMFSNAYFDSRGGERRDAAGSRGRIDIAPELGAEGSQDLFVYSIPKFSLKKGARATLPLWQNQVKLQHLYTLDIRLGRDARGGKTYVRQQERGASKTTTSPLDLAQHSVWHQLELHNDGDVPWTTGAALTMRRGLPIGQDMLTYTSVGAKSLLPLTVAVDVCAGYDERETGREPNAQRFDRHAYARITKQARINVCNYRGEATKLRIQLSMGGKALKASDEGKITINDYRSDDWTRSGYEARLNHHSDVEWNIELEAGETRDLILDYEYYTR